MILWKRLLGSLLDLLILMMIDTSGRVRLMEPSLLKLLTTLQPPLMYKLTGREASYGKYNSHPG